MSGTPYYVGKNSAASGGSTTLTVPVTNPTGANDTVYIAVVSQIASVIPTVGPDTQGNVYTQILSDVTETGAQLYVFESDGAGLANTDSIPVVYSASSSAQLAIAIGDNNVTGSDATVIAHGSSTAPSSGSSGTLSQKEEHAIGFIVNTSTGGTPSWASPWSSNVLQTASQGAVLSIAYQDVSATTALTASGTITSAPWSCAIVTSLVTPVTPTLMVADGVQTEPYSQTLEATGGVGPYSWSITGSLPSGLSLSAGSISGTPSVSGTYTFTTTATDAQGAAGAISQTITLLPNGPGGATTVALPGNLLSLTDQSFEGTGPIGWSGLTNVSGSPGRTNAISITGLDSLRWAATADGLTSINSVFVPVSPNSSYAASLLMLPAGNRDCFAGLAWYTAGGGLIRTDIGNDNPSTIISWQTVTVQGTSPSNAAFVRLVAQVGQANAGEYTHIDMAYLAQTRVQVLVDWINDVYDGSDSAGTDFWDMTPWVRYDANITITRGRSDAISEMQGNTANLTCQNDTGIFTRQNMNSPIFISGGEVNIAKRIQINVSDEGGNWWTRFDGSVSEIDYVFDNTGNTSMATISCADVFAFLNRQDALSSWTREQVLSLDPIYHWSLNDSGNAGGQGLAAETSGNNGPPLRSWNSDSTKVATISWQDTSGGVETLADAAAPDRLDGHEYWNTGSIQPNTAVRGLDSGAVGPYTTPDGAIYLTPTITSETAANYFIGNTGYQLQALLPTILSPVATGLDYTIECWVTMDPSVGQNTSQKYGPYTAISLGDSRAKTCIMAGIRYVSSNTDWFISSYTQPPAFLGLNWPTLAPPTALNSEFLQFAPDTVQIPHHLVITVQGGDPATVTFYVDTIQVGSSFSLPANQVFDTICVGGAFGSTGCWFGGIQLVSIYEGIMGSNQITQNCQIGQYGMWETTTDDCIAQLANFANIPPYWNQISANHNGLTLTDYQDINSSNALSSMQIYEQTEGGLLFVNAEGQLMYHTRDWRMGYGAPDLYLPPDTYDASFGYEIIDQFMVNESAVSTVIFQTGSGFTNDASQDKYGVYATNPIGSAIQLPFIAWNRAAATLGLPPYYYSSDPCLDDFVAWQANSRGDPWLSPGQLSMDILTLDTQTGLKQSSILALEIDNMIAPSGTLPASFPNVNLSMEWFIEGIQETIGLQEHLIQFYCSPGEPQRAWRPGDSVYGALGTTSRIGISAPDVSQTPSAGKDVSHDAGRPYWAPTFTTNIALNSQAVFETGVLTGWAAFQSSGSGTIAVDNGVIYTGGPDNWSVIVQGTGGHPVSLEQSGSPTAVTSGEVFSVGAWVFSPNGDTVQVGVDFTIGNTYSSTTLGAGLVVAAATWTFVPAPDIIVPGGGVNFAYPRANSTTNNAILVVQDLKLVPGINAPSPLNNPADDQHSFIGALEVRGLADSLSLKLQPPMCVAHAISQIQTMSSGAQASSCVLKWDTVHVDTQAGMGAVPGWPNWYVCLVPGYYEIDASTVWQQDTGNAGNAAQGWIIIAEKAAQALAAGTGTPLTVGQYLFPTGEQARINASSINTVCSPSLRTYLGLGDMVAVGAQQDTGTTLNLGIDGGSIMSILWDGYGVTDDRPSTGNLVSSTINGNGGTLSPGTGGVVTTHTKSYGCTFTASYLGNTAAKKDSRRETNALCYQGQFKGGYSGFGAQFSCIEFPYAQMQSDMGPTATVQSISLKCTNRGSWYGSGMIMQLGYSNRLPGAKTGPGTPTWFMNSNDKGNLQSESINKGQTKTFPLSVAQFGTWVSTVGTYLILGTGASTQPSVDLQHYGYFSGGKNTWILTVTYQK